MSFLKTQLSGNWTRDLTTAVALLKKKTSDICVDLFVLFTSGWTFWFRRLMHAIRDVWAPRLQPFWWLTAAAAGSWVCHWHHNSLFTFKVMWQTHQMHTYQSSLKWQHLSLTEEKTEVTEEDLLSFVSRGWGAALFAVEISDLWSAASADCTAVTPAEAEPSQQQPGGNQGDSPAPNYNTGILRWSLIRFYN